MGETYSNLWCFTGIIVFHFKKLPLIISGIFGPGGRQSWKLNTHPVPEQESSHMGSEFWTGKNLLVWEGPRFVSFTSTFLWDTPRGEHPKLLDDDFGLEFVAQLDRSYVGMISLLQDGSLHIITI